MVTVEIREVPADPGHVMHSAPSTSSLSAIGTLKTARSRESYFRHIPLNHQLPSSYAGRVLHLHIGISLCALCGNFEKFMALVGRIPCIVTAVREASFLSRRGPVEAAEKLVEVLITVAPWADRAPRPPVRPSVTAGKVRKSQLQSWCRSSHVHRFHWSSPHDGAFLVSSYNYWISM